MLIVGQLDRNGIAQAQLNGLEDHLKLRGSQYNTCISILFVGYELPDIVDTYHPGLTKREATYSCRFPPT